MKGKKLIVSTIMLLIVAILAGMLVYGYIRKETYEIKRPLVSMEIEGYGTIKMELYPEMAPNTVENFIKLINEGYYRGTTFTKVKEELIQGGEKEVKPEEKEYSIKGEFPINKYETNTLRFERGTVGLYRRDYTEYSLLDPDLIEKGYNSGYGEFFIMTKEEEEFNGYYTPFGKVIEGMDIVDTLTKIETKVEENEETGETSQSTTPVNPPVIKDITVDTFGVKYGQPEVEEAFDINSWFSKYLTYYNQ